MGGFYRQHATDENSSFFMYFQSLICAQVPQTFLWKILLIDHTKTKPRLDDEICFTAFIFMLANVLMLFYV